MRRFTFIIAVILGTLGGAALRVCADNGAPTAAKSVVRAFPERFRVWGATGPASQATDGADSSAAVAAEAGLLERMTRVYSDGKQQVSLTIAEYRDATGAYEAYTAALKPGMKPSTAGRLSAVDEQRLLLQLGDLLVRVDDAKNVGDGDLQALVKLLREKVEPAPLPPIREYLPEQDLVDGSQKYAQGAAGFENAVKSLGRPEYLVLAPEMGFATGAEPEVLVAQYQSGVNHGGLLLIAYPNPQLAEQHLRHLTGVIPGGNATGGLERKGSLLSIVMAPSSSKYAARLRQSINYETQVTWNEPSTTATDPPITSTLVKIFIGTGVFMLIAVVLGVAFGGVRVLTKRFFPGKVFDRPEQMEVLQLGLSGKRIDPRDFY
ncbi:MAG TPA: DUF6599 family protein [Candidatus Acidoferrum sp.]|nr:DUF6599 family protein [Candidatus Acidoferrum sp.]